MFPTFMHFSLKTPATTQAETVCLVPITPRLTPALPAVDLIEQLTKKDSCDFGFLAECIGLDAQESGYPLAFPLVESIPSLALSDPNWLDDWGLDCVTEGEERYSFAVQAAQTTQVTVTPPTTPILDCLEQLQGTT